MTTQVGGVTKYADTTMWHFLGEEQTILGKAKKFGELFMDEFKNSDIGKRFRS